MVNKCYVYWRHHKPHKSQFGCLGRSVGVGMFCMFDLWIVQYDRKGMQGVDTLMGIKWNICVFGCLHHSGHMTCDMFM